MRTLKFPLAAAIAVALLATPLIAADTIELKDQKDKLSYSIGVTIGNGYKRQSIDINPDALTAGVKDAFAGGKKLLTDEEIAAVLQAFNQEMRQKQMSQAEKQAAADQTLAEKNKKDGEAFLAANKKKPGVRLKTVNARDGSKAELQFKVIEAGTGKSPKLTDRVTTHYRGTLVDGTEFDSSYKRNEPVTFGVTEVIAGWTEALQMMKEGAKWQLFIPSELAYGPQRRSPEIGPNSTLVFDIELIKVEGQ
jgi:FKBP-type peptidyl-prolyl cis-trans isomerase FklB